MGSLSVYGTMIRSSRVVVDTIYQVVNSTCGSINTTFYLELVLWYYYRRYVITIITIINNVVGVHYNDGLLPDITLLTHS